MPPDDLSIRFAQVTPADKPRILEISAGVWDGEDYVPAVLDEWLTDPDGALMGAWVEDQLVAFAHLLRLSSAYGWFEGLRIDGAWRNRGIGRAFTRRMVHLADELGMRRIGLSVHLDNTISRHVVESQGFAAVTSFVYMELPASQPRHGEACKAPEVRPVSIAEAATYIARSHFLALGLGFLPLGWRFHPFADSPERALGRMTRILGLARDGRWVGMACTGQGEAGPGATAIHFLEGDENAMRVLVRHILHLSDGAPIETMVPATEHEAHRELAVLSELGFRTFFDARPDVSVYERQAERPVA
jgi:GNAT superfamily N-acetyltransferase